MQENHRDSIKCSNQTGEVSMEYIQLPDEIIKERIKTYAKYVKDNDYPKFAPPDGKCWRCDKQIFNHYDGTDGITGCPYCFTSYCS